MFDSGKWVVLVLSGGFDLVLLFVLLCEFGVLWYVMVYIFVIDMFDYCECDVVFEFVM